MLHTRTLNFYGNKFGNAATTKIIANNNTKMNVEIIYPENARFTGQIPKKRKSINKELKSNYFV